MRKFALLTLVIAISIVLGVTFAWRLISINSLKTKIDKALLEADKNNISLSIKNFKVKKQFPFIIISIKDLKINKDYASIKANTIIDRISIFKYLSAYISRKQYYGDITIEHLNLSRQKTEKTISSMPKRIPIIPFSLTVKQLNAHIDDYNISGFFNIKYQPILNRYHINFIGNTNHKRININGHISNESLNCTLKLSNPIKLYGLRLSNINARIKADSSNKIHIKLKSNRAFFNKLSFEQLNLNTSFIFQKSIISINHLDIETSNNYKVSFSGMLNIKKITESRLKGSISTPFIQIKPYIKYLGKYKDYVYFGDIKFEKVKFDNRLSLESLKSGKVFIKNARFRIDKKSSTFFVKKAVVAINSKAFKITSSGNFEDIYSKNSSIIIHRTKGYPCDMLLSYSGNANEFARIFLEENIIPDSDLEILGKSRQLKGNFSATTVIKGYRWRPKPYFNFDAKLHLNGVEIINENIPSHFVKAWGDVEIKRVVRFSEIKTLFIKFTNLKVKGRQSALSTKLAILYLKPTIGLKAASNAELSGYDFNYLEKALIGRTFIRSTAKIKLNGSVNGDIDNFNFNGTIQSSVPILTQRYQDSLSMIVKGRYKNKILSVQDLKINKTLSLKGQVNMDNFAFRAKIYAKNFHISSLNSVIDKNTLPIKGGLLNGFLSIKGNPEDPFSYFSGKTTINNGFVSNSINKISLETRFNKDKVYIDNATAYILGNKVSFIGEISPRKTINLNINAKLFKLNLNQIRQTTSAKMKLNLPKEKIDIKATVGKLILQKDNFKENTNNLSLFCSNESDNATLKISSDDTNIMIKKHKNIIDIAIRDYLIMPLLTDFNSSNNLLYIDSTLKTSTKSHLSLDNISGNIYLFSKNGRFKDVSNSIKLLSATNIIEMFTGGLQLTQDLPYKKIIANLELNNGVIQTRKNKITALYGDNINVFAIGTYNIINSYINAYITFTTFRVINTLITHIPIMGWIIGGKEHSFSGVSLRVKGHIDDKLSIMIVPIESLGKGFLNIIKRTLTLPFNIFGVSK